MIIVIIAVHCHRLSSSTVLWQRHDMEMLSAVLALCGGNPSVTGGFPTQMTSKSELGFFLLLLAWTSCWNKVNKNTNRCPAFIPHILTMIFSRICQIWSLEICITISMAERKTAVTPLLTHWSYCSRALSHRCDHCYNCSAQPQVILQYRAMTTPWHGNAFCCTCPLWGESISDRWIPHTNDQ